MVYTNRPITKYCCSDSTQTEARILAIFSIVSTLTCLFVLFLIYAHTQSEYSMSRMYNGAAGNKTRSKDSSNTAVTINQSSATSNEFITGITTQSLPPLLQRLVLNDTQNSNYTENETTILPTDYTNAQQYTETPAPLSTLAGENTASENTTSAYRINFGLEQFPIMKVKSTVAGESSENSTVSTFMIENSSTTLTSGTVLVEYSTTENSEPASREAAKKRRSKMNETIKADSSNVSQSEESEITTPTMLDRMANFLLWEHDMEMNRVTPLLLWNAMDLFRGIILLIGISRNRNVLLIIWYLLTSLNCLAAFVVLIPTTAAMISGAYQAIFILIFLVVLMYNLYGLWIVNLVLKETKTVRAAEIGQKQDSRNSGPICNEDPIQFETPVEKF